ncbi:hypothetical protein CEP51_016912, partial [Fusarium floridanum]
ARDNETTITDKMEKLPNEVVCMIVKDLTSRDLFRLSRASHAPIPGTKTTALTLAVLGNHVPTTLLLLANGADPGSRLSGRDVRDPPTVLHLVCMLGLAELADQLLIRQYLEVDPTELLVVYRLN